jgi:hypothetical protein
VDLANNRLLIGAGQVHGLRKGSRFAIYPRGSDLSNIELRQAIIELSEIGATDSWGTVITRFAPLPIEQGAQAILLGAGSVKLVQKVWMAKRDDLPKSIKQTAALDAIIQALQGNGWIEEAIKGDQVDYNVAVNKEREYEIWDRTGQVMQNLRPHIKVNAPNAAADIVRRLVHLAKFNAVKQLINQDPISPLARKLEVEFIGKRTEYDPADRYEPEENFTEPGHTPELKAGEWTGLRIKNTANQRLKITAFDLQPDWGIMQIFPMGAGDDFVEFEPGQEIILPLKAGLQIGYEEGKDVIKVFATVTTTNFRWLELPVLDQPLKRSVMVGIRGPANPLEELMSAFSAEHPPTRNLVTSTYPSHGWITAQVEVNIKKV